MTDFALTEYDLRAHVDRVMGFHRRVYDPVVEAKHNLNIFHFVLKRLDNAGVSPHLPEDVRGIIASELGSIVASERDRPWSEHKTVATTNNVIYKPYFESSTAERLEWHNSDGKLHRIGFPAVIVFVDGIKLNRFLNPAYVEYWENGKCLDSETADDIVVY